MSSEKSLENSVYYIVWLIPIMFVGGMVLGAVVSIPDTDWEEYQAALHISNWTNRTLNVTVYVFGNNWDVLEVTLNHTTNVTLTVTWLDLKETVAFVHCVAPDIYNTVAYTLEPGQWRSVVLL